MLWLFRYWLSSSDFFSGLVCVAMIYNYTIHIKYLCMNNLSYIHEGAI